MRASTRFLYQRVGTSKLTPILLAVSFLTISERSLGATAFSAFCFAAILVAFWARRAAFDIFRNGSPATSPKRPVPWRTDAAFLIFLCGALIFPIVALFGIDQLPKNLFPNFASVAIGANSVADATSGDKTTAFPLTAPKDLDLSTQHPMARLLIRARSTRWEKTVFFVCLFVVCVAAPLQEEFIYRVLVQGTLENAALRTIHPSVQDSEYRFGDSVPESEGRRFRRLVFFAIIFPATIFSLAHSGAPESPSEAASPETLNLLFKGAVATGISNAATLLFGFWILTRFSGATARDLGLGSEFSLKRGWVGATLRRLRNDFFLGCVLFVFIAPIVFGVNATLRALAPNSIVDPIPIFIFALAEGVVYWRTRRYATVVGIHFGLNAASFLALCVNF